MIGVSAERRMKTSSFALHAPAYVSFSGGRTSAFMLRLVLDEGIDQDVHVLFANTGKEREETLSFIDRIAGEWGVVVHWLERAPAGGFVERDFRSASRNGEPFAQLISERGYVPNPGAPYCSTEIIRHSVPPSQSGACWSSCPRGHAHPAQGRT